ncbi:hypothetical protein I4U23_022625 [Adineta vaga]|nr:hypothetical protein I4U23_022625 [Adineta vaga]
MVEIVRHMAGLVLLEHRLIETIYECGTVVNTCDEKTLVTIPTIIFHFTQPNYFDIP